MARIFDFTAVRPMDKVIVSISEECVRSGLRFSGNENCGSMEGMGVKVSYSTDGDRVMITVHKIPFFVSWGMVDDTIGKNASKYGLVLQGRR
jgi:hypothetical protein